MAIIENGNKEPKKEKNIKHGMIAMIFVALTIVLIIIGAYLYAPRPTHEQPVKPATQSDATPAELKQNTNN